MQQFTQIDGTKNEPCLMSQAFHYLTKLQEYRVQNYKCIRVSLYYKVIRALGIIQKIYKNFYSTLSLCRNIGDSNTFVTCN